MTVENPNSMSLSPNVAVNSEWVIAIEGSIFGMREGLNAEEEVDVGAVIRVLRNDDGILTLLVNGRTVERSKISR